MNMPYINVLFILIHYHYLQSVFPLKTFEVVCTNVLKINNKVCLNLQDKVGNNFQNERKHYEAAIKHAHYL